MSWKELNAYALKALAQAGAEHGETRLTIGEKTEMNLENGQLTLLRTTVDHQLRLTALQAQRRGSILLNKVNRPSITPAAEEVLSIAAAAVPDPAHRIAEFQPTQEFRKGDRKPDLDLMYQRFNTFINDVTTDFPRIILINAYLVFTSYTTYFQNSNHVDFTVQEGGYVFSVTFSAKEETSSSSFNYTGFSTLGLEEELINGGSLRILLTQAAQDVRPRKVPEKFNGTVIIAPDCLDGFLRSLLGITVTDSPLIAETSLFKDKLGQQVTSNLLTLASKPVAPEIAKGYFITGDGYAAKNATIIEEGVLKTYLLSLYGAAKTGLPRAANDGGAFVVTPGNQPLAQLIKGVEKGLLLTRFSGGTPNHSGDFSGVAKNSFYIEDGAIKYPLSETMISGNLIALFRELTAVSAERVNFGDALLPWIAAQGITIS
jgi:PmbA protein